MATIRKRDGSYTITVSCGYDKNNKQVRKYKTWTPPDNMTEKQIEKEVQKQAILFEESIKNGTTTGNGNIKMHEFINQYLIVMVDSLSPTTYNFYDKCIKKHIIPQMGHLKIKDIKPYNVQNFVTYLNKLDIKPSTVHRYLNILQSIIRLAVKQDLISTSPASADKLILPRITKPYIEIFTKQEASEMLECLILEKLQYQVLVQLAIITGARKGELVALKFDDVDYYNKKIRIEKSTYKLKGEPVKIKPPKDYEIRTVSIDNNCIVLINMLKLEKQTSAEKLGDLWIDENWLFTKWNGDIMNPTTPTSWFRKFLKRHNLKHRKFHALRHTSATLLIYGGINIKHVADRLGHASISTTNKYLHYLTDADEQATNTIRDMMIIKNNNLEVANDK